MYIHSPALCPKGTHKHSKLYLSPKCWHDISNANTHIRLTYIPQIVGSTYPMQIYIFKNVHSLTLWFFIIFHCVWHDISDINIYIQQTHTPQNVGSIYPIQIYISKNVHPPTLCPKGTQKPTNLHLSPKCWHDISNTNTYIQLTHFPQIVGSTYPMQIYIFKNVHSLTLCPKGTQKHQYVDI